MTKLGAVVAIALISGAAAQGVGQVQQEEGVPIKVTKCTGPGQCETEDLKITIDANWRWTHVADCNSSCQEKDNCYLANEWKQDCASGEDCAEKCVVEGVDLKGYNATFGISNPDANSLRMQYMATTKYGTNIGARTYLLDKSGEQYEQFYMLNKEITMDFDMSGVPCGINAAVYFVEMDKKGDYGVGNNKAGAKYGTGYCDGQCPNDLKYIKGKSNNKNWTKNEKDPNNNTGMGPAGICCMEMDVWESNKFDTQLTVHPANQSGQQLCQTWPQSEGTVGFGSTPGYGCGGQQGDRYTGQTDRNGCYMNPFQLGDKKFYGPGGDYTLDSSKPFTVTTQFVTGDTGDLTEVKQFYIQDGKVIPHPKPNFPGLKDQASLTDDTCLEMNKALGEKKDLFKDLGGMKTMSDSLGRGSTLVLSFWDDAATFMNWLDSDIHDGSPGTLRGPCNDTAGDPKNLRKSHQDAHVVYSNIKYGAIGSTLPAGCYPGQNCGCNPSPSPSPSPSDYCCSWSGSKCDKTTDYCEANQKQCESDCKGHWIPKPKELDIAYV